MSRRRLLAISALAFTKPQGPLIASLLSQRSARVEYANGDNYEGGFNEARQKHGRGVYTWSAREGAHPWVPEGGYPGAWTRVSQGTRMSTVNTAPAPGSQRQHAS